MILECNKNTNYILDKLSAEWEATKKLGDLIALGETEEDLLDLQAENPVCPHICELLLRWGLPCRHWLYPAFLQDIPIPASLVHPRWFLDGPSRLKAPWKMRFVIDHDVSKSQSDNSGLENHDTSISLSTSSGSENHFQELANIEKLKDTRYSGNQYRNHGRNMMLRAAVDAVNQQKKLDGPAAEEFARTFEKHTAKLATAARLQADNQKQLPSVLPVPLTELNLRSFSKNTKSKRKMTGREAAEAVEADKTRKQQKLQKEKEIKQRYQAELATLEAKNCESILFKLLCQGLFF